MRIHLPFKRYLTAVWRHRRLHKFRVVSRHPVMVPVVTFTVLLALSIGAYSLYISPRAHVPDAMVVIISHDRVEETVPSRKQTVGQLLQKLHLTLNQGDVVEPAPTTLIQQDEFRINIYRAVPVEIVDNGHKTFTFSAATTPRSIASQTGTTVYPEDYVNSQPVQDFVRQGAIGKQVVIDRATPVNLNLYGTPVATRTHAKTVGQLMQEKGIKLAKDDQVEPAPTTPITSNALVFVVRNGTKVESVAQPIPMPVQVIIDTGLAYGTSAVRQQGSPGQEVLTYQVALQNGKETGRTLIQSVVTQPAVAQIVVQGANLSGIKGDMALAGIAPGDYSYVDYIISRESGWCPTKWQGEYGGCPAYHGTPTSSYIGYGLCQATPGYKMATAGSDWATNPVTQLRWCSGYATSRYGSWYAAYNHWVDYHNW